MGRWLLAAALAPGLLGAQPRLELYGYAGAGATYAGGWNFGDGSAFGAGVTGRLSPRWALEGEWSRWDYTLLAGLGGVRLGGHANAFTGSAAFHLRPGRRFEPYFVFGGGTVHSPARGYDPLLNVGFGMKARLAGGSFLRPELRLQPGFGEGRIGRAGAFSQARAQLGLGYRW
jgi:hypothetical protein